MQRQQSSLKKVRTLEEAQAFWTQESQDYEPQRETYMKQVEKVNEVEQAEDYYHEEFISLPWYTKVGWWFRMKWDTLVPSILKKIFK